MLAESMRGVLFYYTIIIMLLISFILLIAAYFGIMNGILSICEPLSKKDIRNGIISLIVSILLIIIVGFCLQSWENSLGGVKWTDNLPDWLDLIVWE